MLQERKVRLATLDQLLFLSHHTAVSARKGHLVGGDGAGGGDAVGGRGDPPTVSTS